jgi:hypothetical protein
VLDSPQMLPGGASLLFTLTTGAGPNAPDTSNIVVQSLSTGERKTILSGGSDGRYVTSGHLVYAVGGSVFAAPVDTSRLEVGTPVPVIAGVMRAL